MAFLRPASDSQTFARVTVKSAVGVPLAAIERADDDQVPQRHPEQLHQVQHQRIGGAARRVEKAERRLQSDGEDCPHDGRVQ